jgi:hypothetical protein
VTRESRLHLSQVIAEEFEHLHGAPPAGAAAATPPPGASTAATDAAGSPDLDLSTRQALLSADHVALCLSGGGIRSASFSLGVIQGLADRRWLDRVDYLSTVSGGGFTGGWLSAWIAHTGGADASTAVYDALRGASAGARGPEPPPVAQMRRFSSYLAPRAGLFSADIWTLVATVVRNLLLNWLVLLPVLASLLLLPRVYVRLLMLGPSVPPLWPIAGSVAAALLLLIAAGYVMADLPSLGNARRAQRHFILWALAPVCTAQILLSLSWAWQAHDRSLPPFGAVVALAAFGAGSPWLLSALLGRGWRLRFGVWLAAVASGTVAMTLLLIARRGLAAELVGASEDAARIYAAVDVPLTLGLIALGGMLFTGLASRDMTDADREWWARAVAWALVAAAAWTVVAAIVLFSGHALERLPGIVPRLRHTEGAGQLLLTVLSLGLGAIAARTGRQAGRKSSDAPTVWQRLAMAVALPAFAVLLLVVIAAVNDDLLDLAAAQQAFSRLGPYAALADVAAIALVLLAFGLTMDLLISVNRFSLHGMYRDRLARTFVGASRPADARRPHGFTGLDDRDNLPLRALRQPRPFHVINATMLRTAGAATGWQERLVESFVFTPLHCGAAAPDIGFRRTDDYAGGVTLGSALAISGAAISPSYGERASPALTFLLTMFNARLGVWLGNPNSDLAYRRAAPTFATASLLDELVGRATTAQPYVYVSDGDHFDDLGLYEMVRRRCRYIVVSDADCDPRFEFEDLGNAVRKVRLDFGIPIEFGADLARMSGEGAAGASGPAPHFVIGRIRYSAVDGVPRERDGVLVYLKPAIAGDEPVDVANYGRAHPDFPHESTMDQWFDESQFEAYRALGWQSAAALPNMDDLEAGP